MSLKKTYETKYYEAYNAFLFKSKGPNGTFEKGIIFQDEGNNVFNLTLIEKRNGELRDDVTSNNQDFVKIFSTVVKVILIFTEQNKDAAIEIRATDAKRLRVYNALIQRYYDNFQNKLTILGIKNEKEEPLQLDKSYDWFVIKWKN
ncbi:MAG: hypothetical protein AAF960_29320 [Bacteroidota bacterium]